MLCMKGIFLTCWSPCVAIPLLRCQLAGTVRQPRSRCRLPAILRQMESRIGRRPQTELAAAGGLVLAQAGREQLRQRSRQCDRLPQGPGARWSFRPAGNDVTAKFSRRRARHVDGKPVTTAKLQPDTSGNPTVVELGSLRYQGDRARSAHWYPAERPRQRRGKELSRPDFLPA